MLFIFPFTGRDAVLHGIIPFAAQKFLGHFNFRNCAFQSFIGGSQPLDFSGMDFFRYRNPGRVLFPLFLYLRFKGTLSFSSSAFFRLYSRTVSRARRAIPHDFDAPDIMPGKPRQRVSAGSTPSGWH
jgi:hypothetical protein